MALVNSKSIPSFIKWLETSISKHLRVPLYANAYALIANQVVAATLGILYWTIAARLYPVDVVGENSALISTIIFLAMLSELSLKSAMTRFIPRAGKNINRLILYTFLTNILVGLTVSGFLLTIGQHITITASLLNSIQLPSIWLIVFTISWTLFYVQDGVLTGMRQAKWVLIKNALQSVTKIILLIIFVRSFAEYGLVTAWFLPVPFFVIAFAMLIFWHFMPKHLAQDVVQIKSVTQQEMLKSITGDHVGTILAEAGVRMLPLVVFHFLGEEPTAYFNQAWIIAATFQAIATNMASSFIVEASANMQQISLNSRRILRQMLTLILPAVLLMWLGAPIILYIFGKNYSEQSFAVLRWLVLATIPFMFNAWYLGYARVLSKVRSIIMVQGLQLMLTIGASYFLLPLYGINGIGIAWLIAQSLIAVGVFYKAIPILWPKKELTRNQILRRVDWRFLVTTGQIEKSVCLSRDAHLEKALAAVSKNFVDGRTALTQSCDLVTAIYPNQSTLLSAHKSLRSDGAFYSEWAAWRTGGKQAIRSRMQKAGFKHIKFYWVLPNPTEPQSWIPLNSSKAPLRYLSQSLLPGDSWIFGLLQKIITGMLAFAVRTGMVPHLGAVANKSVFPAEDIFDAIQAEYKRTHPLTSVEQLSFLVKSGGRQVNSKIVILVFDDPMSASPVWVIKIPRVPEDAASLEQEKIVLTELNRLAQEREFSFSIPTFLLNQTIGEVEFHTQTALTGKSFGKALKNLAFSEVAARLTEIQIALAEHTACRSNPQASLKIADRFLNEWAHFSNEALDRQAIAQTRKTISSLAPLPEVFVHNDFTPWNILDTKNGAGIFDWSDANQKGLPLLDLIYGLATTAFMINNAHDPADMQETYQQLLDPQAPMGKVFRENLDSYVQQIGLPPESIGPLRLLTWIRHSLYEFENHELETGDIGKSLDSVCIPLWKMELKIQSSSSIHEQQQ